MLWGKHLTSTQQKEVAITYETLYELLRLEKGREELQTLPTSFLQDVCSYIKEKKNLMDGETNAEGAFSIEERFKVEKQIANIKKIVKELYERRQKKIIAMAVDKSRISSIIIDTSAMLADEKAFFDTMSGILTSFREGLLKQVLDGRVKEVEDAAKPVETESSIQALAQPSDTAQVSDNNQDQPENNQTDISENNQQENKTVRFLQSVEKFVGPELEEYGPYQEKDTANLPSGVADVLVNKGRAEVIKQIV